MDSEFQDNLYENLIKLVEKSEAFYFKDFTFSSTIYRIFNYRLATYTDFLEPGALECRGVMFEMDGDKPLRVACLPMQKFFNLHENPMTMNINYKKVDEIALKADGSLISSFIHMVKMGHPVLRLKSKGSIASDQCKAANVWLNKIVNEELKCDIHALTKVGFTVDMEWCSPKNRIVIGYEKPHLTVLGVRNNVDGHYCCKDSELIKQHHGLSAAWVESVDVGQPKDFIEAIPNMEQIEGYVVTLESGQRFKVKTQWYLTRHYNKDSITIPRRLFEAVVNEATDDLRAMFFDDPLAIKQIDDMEKKVEKLYNHYVDLIERFYKRNELLSRKAYAILGQQELPGLIFPLAMTKFLSKPINYKEWMIKHYKDFNLEDDE